jgi:hypothetical protein
MRALYDGIREKTAWACLLLMALTLVFLSGSAPGASRQQADDGSKHQEKPDDNFLDLTKYAPPARAAGHEEQTASGTVEVVGGSGIPKTPELPLKITLLGLDKESYTLGDKGFFDISLENISSEPTFIPWSPDSSIKAPSEDNAAPGNLHAVISLLVGPTVATGQRADAYGLYGSQSVQGSLKKLEPGQKVRIRIPCTWQFFDEETPTRLLKHPTQRLLVRAQIFLNSSKRITHLPAASANSLVVELKKP